MIKTELVAGGGQPLRETGWGYFKAWTPNIIV